MEITTKGMTTTKIHLINLMTTIHFTIHFDFLKKYPCIVYVKNCHECEFQKFALEQNQKYQCLDTEIQ